MIFKTDESVILGVDIDAIFPTLKRGATPNRIFRLRFDRANPSIYRWEQEHQSPIDNNLFRGLNISNNNQPIYEEAL